MVERLGVASRGKGQPLERIIAQAVSMTSLACWRGVDSRSPSSLYIATDSRFAWPDGNCTDGNQKAFISSSSPDIFGFCGEVRVPTILLPPLETCGLAASESAHARHAELLDRLVAVIASVATSRSRPFTVVHGSRDADGMASQFYVWCVHWSRTTGLVDVAEALPSDSALAFVVGSGERSVTRQDLKWKRSEIGRTSRAAHSCFCDSLRSCADPMSGGGPQVVRIFREGGAETIGLVFNGERYYRGTVVAPSHDAVRATEWRNELFERWDAQTMTRIDGAQRHARPRRL